MPSSFVPDQQGLASMKSELEVVPHVPKGTSLFVSFLSFFRSFYLFIIFFFLLSRVYVCEKQETWQRLQQEQMKLATEQKRNSIMASKIKDLENAKQEAESALAAAIQNRKSGKKTSL